jgi:hypothetical protein
MMDGATERIEQQQLEQHRTALEANHATAAAAAESAEAHRLVLQVRGLYRIGK